MTRALSNEVKSPSSEPPTSDFFVLRTPLLPWTDFLAWGEGLAAGAHVDGNSLSEALAADERILRERLRGIIALPEIREAIYLASPELCGSLNAWLHDPASERGQKVERTLVRYFSRMTGRPTPFGLFAGCTVGDLSERTRLSLAPRGRYQRTTRLDMGYVSQLAEALAKDPKLESEILYRPNSSIYRVAGKLRYARGKTSGSGRSYSLVSFSQDSNLDAALDFCRSGARLSDLAARLLELHPQSTPEAANAFAREMAERQLLVPDLELRVTGEDAVSWLWKALQSKPGSEGVVERLESAKTQLSGLDRAGLGNPEERYQGLAQLLQELPAPVALPRLFQVDMVKPGARVTLGQPVIDEIIRGVELLQQISTFPGREDLRSFAEDFASRYEEREVPLAEALDDELGVGFGRRGRGRGAAPLLEQVDFPSPRSSSPEFSDRHQHLLRLLEGVWRRGDRSLELQPEDLRALETSSASALPQSFYVMAALAGSIPNPDEAFQVHLGVASGPSGSTLLGRFCHADPVLEERVRKHLGLEQAAQPDACFAEIVHLPEGRMGNIIARPVLRAFELPYLGSSGAPEESQIPLTDLRVSVRKGRITLRSEKLGREVIPRLTSAHNFEGKGATTYRFLCALQFQDGIGAGWQWGPLESAPFLPRVTTGRLVLALAQWTLSEPQIRSLGREHGEDRFRAVQTLRGTIGLPRFVCVSEGDQVLRVDLDNCLSVESFAHLVKGQRSVRLMEDFPGGDLLCTEGPEGRFVHELIIPFVQRRPAAAPPENHKQIGSCLRTYPLGSPWLFAKLYVGRTDADSVLLELRSLLEQALSDATVERFFFIRYQDPDWHLRLRVNGLPSKLLRDFLPDLNSLVASLLQRRLVWRFQLDTYEREAERYGGPNGIELAESLFCVDSEAVVSLLELMLGDEGADLRWRLTIKGMDLLLGDLGFGLPQKLSVTKRLRESFGKEFGVQPLMRHQLGEKFRQERKGLEALLGGEWNTRLAPAAPVLQDRSEKIAPIGSALRTLEASGGLSRSIEQIAGSFLHMHANRMLGSAQREQELILYDFLLRLYESDLARRHGP